MQSWHWAACVGTQNAATARSWGTSTIALHMGGKRHLAEVECWQEVIYSPGMAVCKVGALQRAEASAEVGLVLWHRRVAPAGCLLRSLLRSLPGRGEEAVRGCLGLHCAHWQRSESLCRVVLIRLGNDLSSDQISGVPWVPRRGGGGAGSWATARVKVAEHLP